MSPKRSGQNPHLVRKSKHTSEAQAQCDKDSQNPRGPQGAGEGGCFWSLGTAAGGGVRAVAAGDREAAGWMSPVCICSRSERSPGPAHTRRSPPRLSSPSALTCLPEPQSSQFQWWVWQTAFGVRAAPPWRFCRPGRPPCAGGEPVRPLPWPLGALGDGQSNHTGTKNRWRP